MGTGAVVFGPLRHQWFRILNQMFRGAKFPRVLKQVGFDMLISSLVLSSFICGKWKFLWRFIQLFRNSICTNKTVTRGGHYHQ